MFEEVHSSGIGRFFSYDAEVMQIFVRDHETDVSIEFI